jgi:hypothetical protein
MRKIFLVSIASVLSLSLSACGGSSTPEPTPSLSFEELQSEYAQQLGVRGCTAFMAGDIQRASEVFRILEQIVPEWRGYGEGVLREGKAFNAQRCF